MVTPVVRPSIAGQTRGANCASRKFEVFSKTNVCPNEFNLLLASTPVRILDYSNSGCGRGHIGRAGWKRRGEEKTFCVMFIFPL